MIDPKAFYRNFDDLLKRISQDKTGKNFLKSILLEIRMNFANTMHFGKMAVYEERGDYFIVVDNFFDENGHSRKRRIPRDSEAISELLRHGSFIFDNPATSIDLGMGQDGYYAVPAAMVIRSPETRWLVLIELVDGWMREEVLFALNAIRTVTNYRFFSDAINSDLEQAEQIQSSLLPAQPPEIPGYDIAAESRTTEIVGGDLYDFYNLEEDEGFGVAIGDASGHGLPAALLVRDTVIGLRMGLARHMKMVYTFHKLNEVIYRSTFSSRFVSLFYGEFEQDGHIIFVNCGHPAPFIVRGRMVYDLKATGLILGALPQIKIHRSYAHLHPGAVLVLYSDGLFERENEKEELFRIPRLKELVVEHQEKSAGEILNIVFDEIFNYGNRMKWEDDSTLVVVKRLPSDTPA